MAAAAAKEEGALVAGSDGSFDIDDADADGGGGAAAAGGDGEAVTDEGDQIQWWGVRAVHALIAREGLGKGTDGAPSKEAQHQLHAQLLNAAGARDVLRDALGSFPGDARMVDKTTSTLERLDKAELQVRRE